jgi:hypothetical protein
MSNCELGFLYFAGVTCRPLNLQPNLHRSRRHYTRKKIFCFRKSDFKKVVVCFTYPKNYPEHHILVELKSKTLSSKLLDGLVHVCEQEAKKYLGRAHCILILKFIRHFIENNPLCCVSEEISSVKKMLDLGENGIDQLKLNQKSSNVSLKIGKNLYYFNVDIKVAQDYPVKQVR